MVLLKHNLGFHLLCVHARSPQSCLTLCDPMDYIACQALLSMEFSRQEYWSGLLFPTIGDLPYPGMEPVFLLSPASAGGFLKSSLDYL